VLSAPQATSTEAATTAAHTQLAAHVSAAEHTVSRAVVESIIANAVKRSAFRLSHRSDSTIQTIHSQFPAPPVSTTNRLQVEMLEPTTHAGDKPFVVFPFTIHDAQTNKTYHASRRYNEFDSLRAELVKSHPEVSKIPFPGKTLLRSSSMSAVTIRNRSETLQQWLGALGDFVSPESSSIFQEFLTNSLSETM